MADSFILSLGKKAPNLFLRFKIRNTPLAHRWRDLFVKAVSDGKIYERERFVNFNPEPESELQEKLVALSFLMAEIQKVQPEITFNDFDFNPTPISKMGDHINRLHQHFADRHLIAKDLTEKSYSLWLKFNTCLHEMESVCHRMKIEEKSGLRNAFMYLTFDNRDEDRVQLTEDDFKTGVLWRSFGTVYLAYSQVGRHIAELYFSKDLDVDPRHVDPFKYMSPNVRIWFGHNQSHSHAREYEKELREWFERDEAGLFKKLGMSWDPDRLGVKEIPIAHLAEPVFSDQEITHVQNQIFEHSYIHSIELC